jgi:glutamine amidotransferase PdxT
VDNILERFIVANRIDEENTLVPDDTILRVATDVSKVNKKLLSYTVSAQVGDVQQDVKLLSKAQKRVKEAKVVFTTCSGAGLGSLRSLDFDIVVIDEASQVTEPTSLIPLVKGCKRAVLVGDQ